MISQCNNTVGHEVYLLYFPKFVAEFFKSDSHFYINIQVINATVDFLLNFTFMQYSTTQYNANKVINGAQM